MTSHRVLWSCRSLCTTTDSKATPPTLEDGEASALLLAAGKAPLPLPAPSHMNGGDADEPATCKDAPAQDVDARAHEGLQGPGDEEVEDNDVEDEEGERVPAHPCGGRRRGCRGRGRRGRGAGAAKAAEESKRDGDQDSSIAPASPRIGSAQGELPPGFFCAPTPPLSPPPTAMYTYTPDMRYQPSCWPCAHAPAAFLPCAPATAPPSSTMQCPQPVHWTAAVPPPPTTSQVASWVQPSQSLLNPQDGCWYNF